VWGKYSFVMILFQMGTILVGLFSNILGPRWIARYSVTHNGADLLRSIRNVSAPILVGGLIILPLFYGFLPRMMSIYFPSYNFESLVEVAICVYLGVVLFCLNCFFDWYFICTSQERILAVIANCLGNLVSCF